MSNVLYVKCNLKDDHSSRTIGISDYFLEQYRSQHPDAKVTELDLFADEIPGIDKDVFAAWGLMQQGKSFQDLSEIQQHKLMTINELTDQFIDADRYVFSFPMWNLSCPAEVKKYIDNITVVGRTFKYTEKGPIGLLRNMGKKALIISTYGGFHMNTGEDFCTPYVKSLLNFLGIDNVSVLVAEGIDALPDKTSSFIEAAKDKAKGIASSF